MAKHRNGEYPESGQPIGYLPYVILRRNGEVADQGWSTDGFLSHLLTDYAYDDVEEANDEISAWLEVVADGEYGPEPVEVEGRVYAIYPEPVDSVRSVSYPGDGIDQPQEEDALARDGR